MKVLHLYTAELYGGVDTFLVTLAREQALCPEMKPAYGVALEGRLAQECREAGTPVTSLGSPRFRNPLSVWQSRRRFTQLLNEDRPDVVICHTGKPLWLYARIARKFKLPVVYYMHVPIHKMGPFDNLAKREPTPQMMVGVSQHTTQMGKDLIFPDAPSAVINYPMPWPASRFVFPVEERQALRAEFNTPMDAIVIMQAARMDAWKGHKYLLGALGKLKDVPGWVHWMVGGAQTPAEVEYRDGLVQLTKDLGIEDRVRFIGQRKDVPRFLASADIYSQSNVESEGFSLSFTEAFSAGLPIITSDIGSAREMITPETGILPPVRDEVAFADALRSLILDPAKRKQMGAQGRERIQQLCDTRQQMNLLYRVLRQAKGEKV